ncbi:MAG: DUF998 domain-containing protein [Promethearchaeota archaeon]
MEKIESFYNKFNGSYFFFIGVAISIISIIIAIVLYNTGGYTFNILTNYVSDLGATNAPNNAFIAFNIGLIINGSISPFGTLFLVLFFKNQSIKQKWIIWLWFLTNIISALATLLVGLFPEDIMLWAHNFTAFITFASLMFYYLIYGIIVILVDNVSKYHSIPGFILVLVNVIFMISYVFGINESLSTFFEWMVLFGGWAFGTYLGIFSLKVK